MTVHVPFRLVKRGGRKEMVLPVDRPTPRQPDDTLVKALARAFRWKRMLESGQFTTISDLAKHEEIAAPYMTRLIPPDVACTRYYRCHSFWAAWDGSHT